MRRFVIGLAACVLTLPAMAQMTESEFETAFLASFQEAYPDLEIEKTGRFSYSYSGEGGDVQVNIDRAYGEYLTAPDTLADVLQRWVKLANMARQPSQGTVRPNLVAMPRPIAYLDYLKTLGPEENLPPNKPLIGDLVVILMVNSPQALRGASYTELAMEGLSESEAWDVAYANSEVLMGQKYVHYFDNSDIMMLSSESALIATMFADPGFCRDQTNPLVETHFVLVDRDLIAASSEPTQQAKSRFWDIVEPVIEEGSQMSSTPLTCQNGSLVLAERP